MNIFCWNFSLSRISDIRFVTLHQHIIVQGWNKKVYCTYLLGYCFLFVQAKGISVIFKQNTIYSIDLSQILFSFTLLWIDKKALWEWKPGLGESRWNIHFEEYSVNNLDFASLTAKCHNYWHENRNEYFTIIFSKSCDPKIVQPEPIWCAKLWKDFPKLKELVFQGTPPQEGSALHIWQPRT